MAASETPLEPVLVQGWTEGRARRARMFAGLLALVAGVSLWSTFTQPWVAWATAGPAACAKPSVVSQVTIRTPQSGAMVQGAYAGGCLTGRELAIQDRPMAGDPVLAQAYAALARDNTSAAPAAALGLPQTVALTLLGVAVGVLALVTRNGWLGGLGLVVFYFAHKTLGTLQAVVLSGDGGALNVPQVGLHTYGWALMTGWLLLLCATGFVVKHNADARLVAARDARAAGLPEPPGPLDRITGLAGKAVARVGDAAQQERTRSRAAASAD